MKMSKVMHRPQNTKYTEEDFFIGIKIRDD